MTNRDFFRLVIKLYGVYQFLIIALTFLPNNMQYIFEDALSFGTVVSIFLVTIFILGIYFLFIKKPDLIIDFFKLDKGFDNQNVNLNNFNSNSILQVGLVLIGGFLIVDNLGFFISSLILYFKMSAMRETFESLQNFQSLILKGVNLILGFCLIIYRKPISDKF